MSNISNIPAGLTATSLIGDILVAFGYCTRAQVDAAFAKQQEEKAAAADGKARLIGVIIVAEGYATQDQVDHCFAVQQKLRGQA